MWAARWLVLSVAGGAALAAVASAAEVELHELDPGVEWRVGGIEVRGSRLFSGREIEARLVTEERAWYAPWRERPPFDPATFERDLERLRRFYEAEGHFEAHIGSTLTVDASDRVFVRIDVQENVRARVGSVEVAVDSSTDAVPERPASLPLEVGQPFTEAAYRAAEGALRTFYLNRGHAHVRVERRARVSVDAERVDVDYRVTPGPETVFGETRIDGLEDVDAEIVRRELAYRPGERFSLERLERSRNRLLATNLFAAVRFQWETETDTRRQVPIRLRVREKPPREIRASVGYSTSDQFVAQLRWDHFNWLGGGRQLSVAGQYSTIVDSADVAFVQPHLFGRRNRGRAHYRLFRQEEETFTLDSSFVFPSFERRLLPGLDASVGYRAQVANVTGVDGSVEQAIGGLRPDGWLSGPELGLRWDRTDARFTPTSGHKLVLRAVQAGKLWGGDYAFYRLTGEGVQYFSPGFDTVLAGRIAVGFADALGSEENLPIFERFFAGGEKSVRGFARRRLGPKSASDDPLGGRSLLEGSLELRRPLPLVAGLGAVAFLDFGLVSLERFDLPLDDLEFSAGPGLTYATPVGPLSLYVGFPFDPPSGDAAWQLHFSIGYFF